MKNQAHVSIVAFIREAFLSSFSLSFLAFLLFLISIITKIPMNRTQKDAKEIRNIMPAFIGAFVIVALEYICGAKPTL